MNKKTIEISHGVNLNIIETDKFKTNFISVDLLAPLDRRTAAQNALLPKVLMRGTEKYPDMKSIQSNLDMLYAAYVAPVVSKHGDIQSFGFSAFMLDNSYAEGTDVTEGVLDMLEELLCHPKMINGRFDESYVKSEKINLADDIRAQINNKNMYALRRGTEELMRGEISAIPATGTVEDVEAITSHELTEHYKSVLESSGVEIYCIGRCDEEKLTARFRKIFAETAQRRRPSNTIISRVISGLHEVTEDQPVTQAKLSMGFLTGKSLSDKDYNKFVLAREIYGGSPSSKLFMNVREKLSLCYYCQAVPDACKGSMVVTSGIEEKNFEKAKSEILAQLEAVKRCEISESELEAAKKSLINGYREIEDDAGSLKSWYFNRGLFGRDDSPLSAAEGIKNLTAADAAEAFSEVELDTVYLMKSNGAPDMEGEDE